MAALPHERHPIMGRVDDLEREVAELRAQLASLTADVELLPQIKIMRADAHRAKMHNARVAIGNLPTDERNAALLAMAESERIAVLQAVADPSTLLHEATDEIRASLWPHAPMHVKCESLYRDRGGATERVALAMRFGAIERSSYVALDDKTSKALIAGGLGGEIHPSRDGGKVLRLLSWPEIPKGVQHVVSADVVPLLRQLDRELDELITAGRVVAMPLDNARTKAIELREIEEHIRMNPLSGMKRPKAKKSKGAE